MTRYNCHMGETTFRLDEEEQGKTRSVRFRPVGKRTCHDSKAVAAEASRVHYGKGGFSARVFVGLSVGEAGKFTVDDIIKIVVRVRKEQEAGPDASIITQKGIYEDKKNRIIVEDSVQIILIDLTGAGEEEFTEQVLELAEVLVDELEQETVIVEIQEKGVTVDVYGVTADAEAAEDDEDAGEEEDDADE